MYLLTGLQGSLFGACLYSSIMLIIFRLFKVRPSWDLAIAVAMILVTGIAVITVCAATRQPPLPRIYEYLPATFGMCFFVGALACHVRLVSRIIRYMQPTSGVNKPVANRH